MRYLPVTETAKKWDISERSVRNYCAKGRVSGAFLTGKTWNIPENAEKIGLLLAIIKRCQTRLAAWTLHFRKKLQVK